MRAAGALFLAISLGQYHIVTGVRSLLDHERLIGWGGEKHSQTDDTCHVMRNTELAGDVVLWGATNKVDTAEHCCSMCNKVRTLLRCSVPPCSYRSQAGSAKRTSEQVEKARAELVTLVPTLHPAETTRPPPTSAIPTPPTIAGRAHTDTALVTDCPRSSTPAPTAASATCGCGAGTRRSAATPTRRAGSSTRCSTRACSPA